MIASYVSALARSLKIFGYSLFLVILFVSAFLPFSDTLFISLVLVTLLGWVSASSFVWSFNLEDVPFLFLLMGTIIFGRAFSILGLTPFGFSLFMTEIVLGISIALWLLKPRKSIRIWTAMVNPDLLFVFLLYILFGTVHLLIGVFSNGYFAVRDIVFCHYGILFFIVLVVLNDEKKIKNLAKFFVSGISPAVLVGCLIFFLHRSSRFPLFRFIKETKQFNWGVIFGLIAIFVLCFFAFKNKHKGVKVLLIYLALLFVLLTMVRAAWVGLVAAFVFLGFLLKKEMIILIVIVPLVISSVFLLDLFPGRRDITPQIWSELEGMLPGEERSIPRMNFEWRLSIWKQTLQQISEKPIFGWGFGSFPEYSIRGKVLSQRVGVGLNSGIIPPHNHLLSIVYKTGILGLILFAFINIRIFLYGFTHLKKCHSEFHRRLLTAFLGGLIYWHSIAFFFDVLESPPTGIYVWILLGMVVSTVNADRRLMNNGGNGEL